MIGIDRDTGARLGGDGHIAQSIRTILTTPIGSRVMRRDFGSRLPDLIDAPISGATVIEIYAATAEAIAKWEPRVRLSRVRIDDAKPKGQLRLLISYLVEDRASETGVVLIGGAT